MKDFVFWLDGVHFFEMEVNRYKIEKYESRIDNSVDGDRGAAGHTADR